MPRADEYSAGGAGGADIVLRCLRFSGLCPQYSFSSANNQITNTGYTYDAAGNLTGDSANTYQYDGEGRPKSAGSARTATFTYNALGELEETVETSSPAYTQDFIYSPWGEDLGNGSGGGWWDENMRLNGRVIGDNTFGATVFKHFNLLGTIASASDHSGAVLGDSLAYPWGQPWTGAGTVNDGHVFGMMNDQELLYAQYRRYHPNQGRWLSPDPLGGDITNPQSLNRYSYVLNNPTTLTDPLGLFGHIPEGCTADIAGGYSCFAEGPAYAFLESFQPCDFFPAGCGSLPFGGTFHVTSYGFGGGGAPPPAPKPNIITWPQLQTLVHENNESNFCDELIDCIVFNESTLDGGFDANALGVPFKPKAPERGGVQQAKGLMQITQNTATTINNVYHMATSGTALYEGLSNPAINIMAGSNYLQYLYGKYGSESAALAHYGPKGYADEIRNCVEQLQRGNLPEAEAAAHGH